jgi:hypothetical protein
MRPVETIPGMGEGRRKMEGVNSTMIYRKNFCKSQMYPQYNNNIIIFFNVERKKRILLIRENDF